MELWASDNTINLVNFFTVLPTCQCCPCFLLLPHKFSNTILQTILPWMTPQPDPNSHNSSSEAKPISEPSKSTVNNCSMHSLANMAPAATLLMHAFMVLPWLESRPLHHKTSSHELTYCTFMHYYTTLQPGSLWHHHICCYYNCHKHNCARVLNLHQPNAQLSSTRFHNQQFQNSLVPSSTNHRPNAVCSNPPLQVPPSPNTWNRFYGSSIDGLPVRPAWHFYTPSYQQHCKCFSVHHFCVWVHQACSSLASALWYNAVAHGTYMRGTNSTSSVTAINLPSIQSPTQPL